MSRETMEPNLVEDIIPISELGAGSKVVREVMGSGRPKVITERGRGVAVILDAATYEAMRTDTAVRDLKRDLEAAIADVDSGGTVEHAEVMREIRDQLGVTSP